MSELQNLIQFLQHKAYKLRVHSLTMTTAAGSGHPTSALSAADIVAVLFFYAMRFDPENYNNPNNDRFILSKGHASPVLYAVWNELGKLSDTDLLTYRKINSVLEGHPTLKFTYTEAATGSLGIGLSIGLGEALAAKIDKRNYRTYVLMGDSETAEGSVWEAAELASHYKSNQLIGIIDCNRLGQSTSTLDDWHTERIAQKWHAFGWKTFIVDGHDMQELVHAFKKAHTVKDQPSMIIAKTIKGYGVAQVENKEGYHGKVFTKQELEQILPQLKERFAQAANYSSTGFVWKPQLPTVAQLPEAVIVELKNSTYKMGEELATRKAYGQAVTALGRVNEHVVCLDAEVKNSTYADIFQERFPERFVQCYIAEQNMIGMATGINRRNKVPFASTFGSFFSRAYDQIRMAAIGTAALRLVGSHAGVSIGQDGPSQMALEDIALMRALPESIVLYPCDAVSTYHAVELMGNYHKGISYLRTTRANTPVIYDNNHKFKIGGCTVLKQSDSDKACIVAAGITVFEALKAYELLQKEGIAISVIDLYSIKPLDAKTLDAVGTKSNDTIITVEDHYLQGGIGEAVCSTLRNKAIRIENLAVTQLPRSGKPEELLAMMNIDAAAIVKKVKQLL